MNDLESNHPFHVQGVALVVDQRGHEARMIFRYPTTAPSTEVSSSSSTTKDSTETDHNNNTNNKDKSKSEQHHHHHKNSEADLFFRMDSRQMSKLFRPKSTLCNQPMTLSVGGTIFCCRAILLNNNSNSNTTDDATDSECEEDDGGGGVDKDDTVELLSIIVALVPRVAEFSMSTIGGWYEEERDMLQSHGILGTSELQPQSKGNYVNSIQTSASFFAVVRVHLSLARLCPVLEREERRCQYVTLQTLLCLQVRKLFRSLTPPASSPSSTLNNLPRSGSSVVNKNPTVSAAWKESQDVFLSNAERDQEILETIMTATPPVDLIHGIAHKGNLARELVQFYHALTLNDENDLPKTPLSVLGGEGFLYVNGHVAVAVEAVGSLRSRKERTPKTVWPYQTVLFPHMSRKDLLESLSTSSSSMAPRRIQQFLLTAFPQKSLTEIASDSNLSLPTTLEVASYLVEQGIAIASPVITRNSRLVCMGVEQIQEAALAFSYMFESDLDLFNLVAFVTTSGWTLGEAIVSLVSSEEPQNWWLRTQLLHSLYPKTARHPNQITLGSERNMSTSSDGEVEMQQAIELEEVLYKMVVWLCARGVVAHLQEYLVEPFIQENNHSATAMSPDHESAEKKVDPSTTSDDALLRQLREKDFLSGNASLQAIGRRLGVDVARLRGFAARHGNIRLISRLATSRDDWLTE